MLSNYYASSSHVWIESWALKKTALKNWCFWTVVLEKLESPLDSKEIKAVNLKRNQPWIFIGSADAEAEAPILWPPVVKSWPLKKTLTLGKFEGRRRSWRQRMIWLDASPAQWTWIWAKSGRWWRTGKPGVLQSTGSQRVRHDSATEHQQYILCYLYYLLYKIWLRNKAFH